MFQLPPLPYALQALSPHISERTLEFHYGKHHQAYVNNLNQLIQGTPLETASLEGIIEQTAQDIEKTAIFNNAAQAWNHTFFWNSMTPKGGGELKEGSLKSALSKTFGNLETFQAQFKNAALSQFGSGWAWLVVNQEGNLAITKTGNADLPLVHGQKALLTCDVWEHAYYLDYQNRRPDYVDTFLKHLVNWSFAEDIFKG